MSFFFRIKIVCICIICLLFSVGCANKKINVLEDATKNEGAKIDSSSSSIKTKNDVDKNIPVNPLEVEEPNAKNIQFQSDPFLKPIYFEFDDSSLSKDATETLYTYYQWLKKNNYTNILIEGHTDDRGSVQYNLGLGQERASKVRRYLSYLGINPKRISTISYGEEKPAEIGENEEAWSKNRRAEILISKK